MKEMHSIENRKSQKGQALVEYVLILTVVVALILGLMTQFYRPFGQWLDNYMGAYLECLLDVGELPSLGGATSGECNAQFRAFSVAGGRSPIAGKTSGKDDGEDSAKNRGASPGSGEGGNSASSSAGSGRSDSASRGFAIGGRGGADGAGAGSANANQLGEKLPESQVFRLRSSSPNVGPFATSSSSRGIAGTLLIERAKVKKEDDKAFSAAAIDEGETVNGKAKKLVIKPSERKVASEEPDKPWSFSEYIKFMLIILIIVALVLFLGGQILQITKSMDKE